jgi:tetratricopeptide (TPR) repeat protein
LLQLELIANATMSARYEGACVLEVAEQLRHDSGLDLVAELAGRVPQGELLTQALGAAQRRYDSTSEQERGMPLLEALTVLAQLILQAIGMAGRVFDRTLLQAMPSLAPLASLSPALAVVHKNHESALAMLSGHSESARRAYLEIARRVSEPDGAGLEETHRFHVCAASLWAAGMMESILGRPSTLERAAAIEANPLFSVSAQRMRALHALALGDGAGAEHYRAQTELLQIQNCPPQLFEGAHAMQATFGYQAIGDLVRVKQCLVDVEAMARDHEGWKPVVHCGRGAYQMLRGDYTQALLEFERGLAMMTVGHLAWTYCAGSLLWALVHQEDCQSAAMRGHAFFAQMEAAGREYCTDLVLVPLALAESRIGLHQEALRHIQNAIGTLSAEGGVGVRLGEAYEVRAYIALRMADVSEFHEYAKACEVQYRLGSQNGLLARHGKLMNAARTAGLIEALDTTDADVRALAGEEAQSTVLTLLRQAHGSTERSERALQLLGRAIRSSSGFLYLTRHDSAVLVAQLGSPTPWLEMDDLVARLLAEAVEEEDTTQTGDSQAETPVSAWTAKDARFMPILLSHLQDNRRVITGVALMSLDSGGARRVPTTLVRALSKALFDAGDALSQHLRFDQDD